MSAPPVYKLEQDLCRCCHAEGSFFNLDQSVYNLGQKEVYSDMLRNSLNVEILPMAADLNMMTYTICGDCVVRLRDAHYFKHQVTECEQRFKQMYENMVIQCPTVIIEIKEENPGTNDEGDVKSEPDASDDDRFQHRFNNSEDDIDIKEPKEEPKKAKPKAAKSRIRKPPVKKSQSPTPSGEPSAEEPPVEDPDEDEAKKKGPRALQKRVTKGIDYRIKGDSYICTHCEKVSHCRHSLREHIKRKHFKITCPYCNLAFQNEVPLTIHKLQEHNIDDRFKCKACDTIFNAKRTLAQHTQNFHMLGKKIKCDFCEYESFTSYNMYRHKMSHKTVRDFECKHCRKSFKRKTTLLLHEKIHTGDKRKVCKECGKAFVQKASLNYHMTKYHPEVNF